jgi:hypothetical protein
MGVYNNNKDGTRSTLANTIQVVDAPMEQFVTRGEFSAVTPNDVSADNKLVAENEVTKAVITMPTASASLVGTIVQYVGTTTANYTNGYFYKCVSDGAVTPTYSWVEIISGGRSSLHNIIDSPTVGNTGGIVENDIENNTASNYAHAEGYHSTASGHYSHAEGNNTQATYESAHAEGNATQAKHNYTHAEGDSTVASRTCAHAEGSHTTASGFNAHAEGYNTTASGNQSHAEGGTTTASGNNAHAEGNSTVASGNNSHASGYATKAGYECQTVVGKYNNNKSTTYFEVGNGTTNNDTKNIFEVYNNGAISQDDGNTQFKFSAMDGKKGYYDNLGDFYGLIDMPTLQSVVANSSNYTNFQTNIANLSTYDFVWRFGVFADSETGALVQQTGIKLSYSSILSKEQNEASISNQSTSAIKGYLFAVPQNATKILVHVSPRDSVEYVAKIIGFDSSLIKVEESEWESHILYTLNNNTAFIGININNSTHTDISSTLIGHTQGWYVTFI